MNPCRSASSRAPSAETWAAVRPLGGSTGAEDAGWRVMVGRSSAIADQTKEATPQSELHRSHWHAGILALTLFGLGVLALRDSIWSAHSFVLFSACVVALGAGLSLDLWTQGALILSLFMVLILGPRWPRQEAASHFGDTSLSRTLRNSESRSARSIDGSTDSDSAVTLSTPRSTQPSIRSSYSPIHLVCSPACTA